MTTTKSSSKTAEYLLDVQAVKLSPDAPFTWSSGWKSPIYCDNRVLLSFVEARNFVANQMAELIKNEYPKVNTLCGVATAGIAIGAIVADKLGIPYAYCRPKPKAHGMKNQLEGRIPNGANVVVVEDLISTGGSSLKVVNFLRGTGIQVLGITAIFDYGFPHAEEAMETHNCVCKTLTGFEELLPVALEKGLFENEQLSHIKSWRKDPANWGK